jgi:nicotinate-nucleotide pyrophosphorylase (carboxylating)
MTKDEISDSRISRLVELALMEDVGLGDITSEATIAESQLGRAEILCKADGVIAGLEVASLVFTLCDHSITVSPLVQDGTSIVHGQRVAIVDGIVREILKGERTSLNFLQRMSGIATLTRQFVHAVAGTQAKITDTRKTAPALRVFDKWAVRLGGGVNHRFGLDDMVLIKDNHIAAAGGVGPAVDRCKRYLADRHINIAIEVETKNLEEVKTVLACGGIQRVMLDNFPLDEVRKAVELIAHRVEVEASGGIRLETVRSIAETGVDFISIGALTHSARALDLSLELLK